jgi:predicted site-specific integrase-resolvase
LLNDAGHCSRKAKTPINNDVFNMSRDDKNGSRRRAAAYVRISTEHQQCSISNQMSAIREFAKRRGLEIVEENSDEDKTGLKP